MWSILYTDSIDPKIYRLGPYEAEEHAMMIACKAHEEGEFDINDQHVYLLGPKHELQELTANDLEEKKGD